MERPGDRDRETPAAATATGCEPADGHGPRDGRQPAARLQDAARRDAGPVRSTCGRAPASSCRARRRSTVGPATPRDLLLQHGRGRPQEQAADDPAPDRPARAQEVPQAARPDLRPAQDGGHGRRRSRSSSTTSSTASSTGARWTSPRSSPSRSPPQVFLTLLGLPLDELDTLPHHEGRHHPPRPRDRDSATGRRRPATTSRRSPTRSTTTSTRSSTSARRSAKDDLLSHFLDAEVEGDRLTREDILDICFLFLIAGLDTVTATLDCMFSFLAQHPEHRRQLVEDPAIIPNAIEELLRWETPVMGIARVAVHGHRARRVSRAPGRPASWS